MNHDTVPDRRQQLIAQEGTLYGRLLEALPAAVYTCDAAGHVTFFNRAAAELWGREPELGKDLWCGSWRIYRPDGTPLPLDECPMSIAMRERRAVRDELIVIERSDGTRRTVLPHPQPIFDDTGQLLGAINMLVDVTEHRRTELALHEGAARLAAIVGSSDDAIIGKTLDGVITSWNRAAERIFGYKPDEAIGRHISLIIPEERLEEERIVLARLRRGERVEHFETERRAKDGQIINISLTASPIRDATGRIIGASKVARDVSDRKRSEAALRDANRRKDEFLAMLSHELRNPLNAMLGWMRMLRSGVLDPEATQRALEVVERNIDHESRLIADLLDVSRIATGKLALEMGRVDLAGTVRSVVETMSPSARAAGITLTTHFTNETLPVRGDAERLRQIVGNLLSNALKFTPRDGFVRIDGGQVDGHVRIRVSDTGKGIDREFLPHVFERFAQADEGAARANGGLGLGLVIVRQIVELHGGQVQVASAGIGRGATFTVDLPIAPVEEPVGALAVAHPQPDAPSHALDGVHVLVVEDHTDSRELIAEVLRQQGAVVATADNARDGLAAARRVRPDVMVCDIGLPDDDGLALIRQIRAWPLDEGGAVPALALTGYARPDDRARTLSSGFQLHLAKPAEPRTLVESVARLSRRVTRVEGRT